jgi:8-oxo-dGTP diphosphatase
VGDDALVLAAGGVVTRRGSLGGEVLVVHRRRYGDWTFPKGKNTEGEPDEACAVREVEEETGLACRLERELATVRYRDGRGRPKQVRYWQMAPVSGSLTPRAGEIDDVRWVTLEEAAALLTYQHDTVLLDGLRSYPGRASAVA